MWYLIIAIVIVIGVYSINQWYKRMRKTVVYKISKVMVVRAKDQDMRSEGLTNFLIEDIVKAAELMLDGEDDPISILEGDNWTPIDYYLGKAGIR